MSKWMLRQDGNLYAVDDFIYVDDCDNLSSEAVVAAFLLNTKSKDAEFCQEVIDMWMAMLIENKVGFDDSAADIYQCLDETLTEVVKDIKQFQTIDFKDIRNKYASYSDTGQLYDFIDDIREHQIEISEDIKQSINQQFCRIEQINDEIEFRISSVQYNWLPLIQQCIEDNFKDDCKVSMLRDNISDVKLTIYPSNFYYTYSDKKTSNMILQEIDRETFLTNLKIKKMRPLDIGFSDPILDMALESLKRGSTYKETQKFIYTCGGELPDGFWNKLVVKERHEKCRVV